MTLSTRAIKTTMVEIYKLITEWKLAEPRAYILPKNPRYSVFSLKNKNLTLVVWQAFETTKVKFLMEDHRMEHFTS